MQDKVAEVDYGSASSHYESGSKHPAQPICRLAALTTLRAINFLVCVCGPPETTWSQRRARIPPALVGIAAPVGGKDEG